LHPKLPFLSKSKSDSKVNYDMSMSMSQIIEVLCIMPWLIHEI
jgi:hypothetical protein